MNNSAQLYWLPGPGDWRSRLKSIRDATDRNSAWREAVALANCSLDFVQTNALDTAIQETFKHEPPADLAHRVMRLAILGSSTFGHLHGAIRVAGLRRGIWIVTYENDFGQYFQEILDKSSGLHRFNPQVVLFAFDPYHFTGAALVSTAEAEGHIAGMQGRIKQCWSSVRAAFSCRIIQQTLLPVLPAVLGNNEQRLAASPARVVEVLNQWLRIEAAQGTVDLLAHDVYAAAIGLREWHDVALWHRSKQEVSPKKAPLYGDLVGRVLAAQLGRSFKCLILDLDNTLWGGVIGDDGLEGIALGQGSPLGEAFVAIQAYALSLANRGIILAVCSKNEQATALLPFEKHTEMVLRRHHIASFVANWDDKATNVRRIAAELNIGLDAMVFLDDNPFERDLVRRELPVVAVPEIGDEPSLYPYVLQDAGYFEGLTVTDEDTRRTSQYQSNRERENLRATAVDLDAYLRDLHMELQWRPFDQAGMQRIEQLINKTNQFNLRTQRYSTGQLCAIMNDANYIGLQFKLIDRHGDNGVIAVVIGKRDRDEVFIDTWLMSCRVLGRQTEAAMLNVVVQCARKLGAARLIGEYQPTPKNGMVKDHYPRLGFVASEPLQDGCIRSVLELASFVEKTVIMAIKGEI